MSQFFKLDGPSDHYLIHGHRHKCACGHFWYDSDGGPCHAECSQCAELVRTDDTIQDSYGDLYCENCGAYCSSCGKVTTNKPVGKALCDTCQEFYDAVKEASFDELSLFILDELPKAAKDLLKDRLSSKELV